MVSPYPQNPARFWGQFGLSFSIQDVVYNGTPGDKVHPAIHVRGLKTHYTYAGQ